MPRLVGPSEVNYIGWIHAIDDCAQYGERWTTRGKMKNVSLSPRIRILVQESEIVVVGPVELWGPYRDRRRPPFQNCQIAEPGVHSEQDGLAIE